MDNLKSMKKGETLNPNGRPKKSFRTINDRLKSEGFEPVTHSQFIEAYCLIFSLDEEAIQNLADDSSIPLSIRLIIQDLTNPQTSGKAIQDMRNYVFGTATQNVKQEVLVIEQPLFPDLKNVLRKNNGNT